MNEWNINRKSNGYTSWKLLTIVGAFNAHVNDNDGSTELVRPSGVVSYHESFVEAKDTVDRQLNRW